MNAKTKQKAGPQRAADIAAGYPTEDWMSEDPKKSGIPLFLQAQNRRALTTEQQAQLDKFFARTGADAPERIDWYKPKSLSWERWDQIQSAAEAKRTARRDEALARLREREAAKPKVPRLPGYKGHLSSSRKARVHECHDTEGPDKALKLADSLGLKDGTALAWIKMWAKEEKKKK